MKRKLLLSSAVLPALLASGAMAQVVNFHDDNNNGPLTGLVGICCGGSYNELFAGQGAYSDPGNDIWNGFGMTGGYGSSWFYDGSPGATGIAWPEQYGNPGNPYAAYSTNGGALWITSDGTSLFNTTGYGTSGPTMDGNATSSGQYTQVTLRVGGYSEDSGNPAGNGLKIPNGTPSFLLLESAETSRAGSNEVFTLQNVPPGAHGLYLYGANFNNNAGTLFSVSSGSAHNGMAATLNGQNGTPAPTFVEGQNFVIFENVSADVNSNITITASPNPLAGVGNSNVTNEIDVNGFQLILNPPPTAVGSTAAQNVWAGGTANFSFSPAFAASPAFQWQSIIGGVTNDLTDGVNISGATTTNLKIANVAVTNIGLYQCVISTATATNTSPAAPLTILTSLANGPVRAGDPISAIGNVLQPGDLISDFNNTVNTTNDYPVNSVPPPFNMVVGNVEDYTLDQYVNFGSDGSTNPFVGPVGFTVTPNAGVTIVTGMRLLTASSHPEDDPKDYLLEGSNNGGETFTPIAGGLLGLPAQRNAAGGPINITNQVLKEIDFTNSAPYATYRLTFTNVNDYKTASNGVQIAEVQFLGSLAATPPGILRQPESNEVLLAGTTFHPSVIASGPGPLTYKWYYNTTNQIPSATNATFTLANLQITNSGAYSCIISNSYGSTNSTALSLTVVKPTPYQKSLLAFNPLGYWPLNETSGTVAYDNVNGYNGTYLGSGFTLAQPGVPEIGFGSPSSSYSVAFDGTTNVDIPEGPFNLTTPLTIIGWVQISSSSYFMDILGHGDSSYRITLNGSGDPGFAAGNDNGDATSATAIADDNWHMVAGVYAGGSGSTNNGFLYVDGMPAATNDISSIPGNGYDLWLAGAPDYNNRYFLGNLCHLTVIPQSLSGAQIQGLYFAAGNPPVISSQPIDSVVLAGSNITFSVTAIGYEPLTYQWYGPETSGQFPPTAPIPGATNSTLTISSAEGASGGAYFVVVTDANGFSTTNTTPNGTPGGALLNVVTSPLSGSYFSAVVNLNPLAYWPLNETNPPPAWPAIATNRGTLGAAGNAIYSGLITYQNSPDQTNGANSILGDGYETQVVLPYQSALATVPLTLEGWFYPDTGFNNGHETLMSDGEPTGTPTGFWINAGFYEDTNNGQGDFNLLTYYNDSAGTPGVNIDITNISPNAWYYVAVTVAPNPASNSVATGYRTTFYINGTNAGSQISAFVPNADAPFKIGNWADEVGYNFLGGMDQVAFYTNALSAATIKAHYQAGTNKTPPTPYDTLVLANNPLLYYRLDEPPPLFPAPDTGPVATNYGATGALDNGVYLTGTFPGSVPGPKGHGFPGDDVAVAFEHIYWMAGGSTNAGIYTGTLGNTGLTGFVDVPEDSFNSLDYLGPVSLAAWVQATANDSDRFETFVGRGDPSYRLDVDGTSDNLLHFAYGGAGDQDGNPPAANVTDGLWHFVVGSWDGTNQYLYVDGVSNAASAATGLPPGDDYDFTIGEAPDDTGRLFDGNVAEVAIFRYALSAAQVLSLYDAAEVAAEIVQEPIASQTIGAGTTTTISVGAVGYPTLTYKWSTNNGATLLSGPEFLGTTSSTLTITNATTADSGNYTVVVSNNYGSVTSSISVLTVVQYPIIVTFNTNGTYWTTNDNGVSPIQGTFIAKNVIELTDKNYGEITSFFFDIPMYIGAFKASFIYTDVGSDGVVDDTADGFTFCIQNSAAGASALQTGAAGSGLGYYQLTNSAALATELYDNNGDNGPGIAVTSDGQGSLGVLPGGYLYGGTGKVSVISGHGIRYNLFYDGNTLTVTLTDTKTPSDTLTTNYVVGPLSAIVGGDSAFIGFTAATGGVAAIQTIANFSFTPIPVLSAAESGGSVVITWPTAIGDYSLQQSSSLSSTNWTAVPGPYTTNARGLYQYDVPSPTGNQFYRLVAP